MVFISVGEKSYFVRFNTNGVDTGSKDTFIDTRSIVNKLTHG
jgi:hypothetical protein